MIRASPCCLRARYRHAAAAARASSAATLPATCGRGKRRPARPSAALSAIRSGRGGSANAWGTATGAARTARCGAGGTSSVRSDAISLRRGRRAQRSTELGGRRRRARVSDGTASVPTSTACRPRGSRHHCGAARRESCPRNRRGVGRRRNHDRCRRRRRRRLRPRHRIRRRRLARRRRLGERRQEKERVEVPLRIGGLADAEVHVRDGGSDTPLEPTAPTASPSATSAPRPTDTEPRCSSVTE